MTKRSNPGGDFGGRRPSDEQVAAELLALSPQASLVDEIRDRLAAQTDVARSLGMFRPRETTLPEEVATQAQRRMLTTEGNAYGVINAVLDQLITPQSFRRSISRTAIAAPNLARVKQLQSSVYFWAEHAGPHVILGQKDGPNKRFKDVLELAYDKRKSLSIVRMHIGDLAAFQALPHGDSREYTLAEVGQLMAPDGQFLVSAKSPGSVTTAVDDFPGMTWWYASRRVDLEGRGLRSLYHDPALAEEQIRQNFAAGRISEQTINAFSVPEHLAYLVGALAPQ